ncbi:type II secretion system F family protein [Microbacterium sp. Marseille-Q6648]|uniref:type II secretion system F family protein n=1 Tax=Microbacterium sp. Marseille-Q6648 TaxID=2937991 RepID=UPI00203BD452|nr:type II secretion system F family protein [Microbacterium sp. Marseille-Q6648]
MTWQPWLLPGVDIAAVSIVLGVTFALGVTLLSTLAPRWWAPSLARRIAPYIRDVTDPQGTTLLRPGGLGPLDVGESARSALRRAGALLSGSAVIERRLRQAGRDEDVATFRGRQLAWTIVGIGGGGALSVVLAVTGSAAPAVWLLPLVGGMSGAIGCDMLLTHAARTRIARIDEELPTVLEFLALCLSAGEGILDSLRRVSDVGAGELTAELRGVVVAVGTGSPLPDALTRLGSDVDVPALARAIDQLVAAIDRGAPLAQVLHSQAADAREAAKRTLIERAGRKEIYMLVPLVFLILPLSVLFAVFPGIFMLRLGIG